MGKYLNKFDAATLLNVEEPTIARWAKREGMPCVQFGSRGKEWQFDKNDIILWYSQKIKKNTDESQDQARTRKLIAEATLSELDVEQRLGALILVSDIADIVEDEYSNVRARLLSLPTKLAPALYQISDLIETQEILEQGIQDVLKELSLDEQYNRERKSTTKSTATRTKKKDIQTTTKVEVI